MVIRHNKHREDLWHLRFRESLSKKECVRKFVTDGTACRSEVYATLRQFESSTSCEYTTGHRPPGTVRRSQRRPRRTSQPPDQELNWRALASQRCRAKLKQAECTLPFGNLRRPQASRFHAQQQCYPCSYSGSDGQRGAKHCHHLATAWPTARQLPDGHCLHEWSQ